LKNSLFILFQYLAPVYFISRVAGWLAENKTSWLKTFLIHRFIRAFDVNMEEAENSDADSYACFNDFFCRALKPGARPFEINVNSVISPVDGAFSQLGKINEGQIFQAKGHNYSVNELLGDQHELAEEFQHGEFATIYLSPKDYHRLHMPTGGTLISMTHVPGYLFSVNPITTDNVPRLFARNERVVCVFETPLGKVVMVLVGAMVVASIETVWAGLVAPVGKDISTYCYRDMAAPQLEQGQEMGRFKLGSTVIMLFPEGSIEWLDDIGANTAIKMGEPVASRKAY